MSCVPHATYAQDWIKTGTGLGLEKPRVAVADFAPRVDPAKNHSALFTQVVRDDLQFSGILDLVSPSFYPPQAPSQPSELRNLTWTDAPANASMVAFGNLTDEIINKLSGGLPSIAGTQIAFVSSRTGTKEIWLMDYDGANQHPLTSLRSIALTPRWSPDASRIAFTCFKPMIRVTSAQICMYSMDTGKLVSFPQYKGSNSSPSWSPDGSQIIFSSSMQGNPELYVADASGGRPRRLTNSSGANTSATWNPKTGQTVVFVSDRGGVPQLYSMNSDGTSINKFDLPDMGYVIDPAWSPNGQILAFSWRRPNGNYDIYVMEAATSKIIEITRDAGRNERPSWAPDGRHIVFESTRGGTRQIWSMLADGTQPHQLTTTGHNESPNWSPK
jgi:TolB protein